MRNGTKHKDDACLVAAGAGTGTPWHHRIRAAREYGRAKNRRPAGRKGPNASGAVAPWTAAPLGSRNDGDQRFGVTLIRLGCLAASAVFGSSSLRMPLSKSASILSSSTPSGRRKERWNEP